MSSLFAMLLVFRDPSSRNVYGWIDPPTITRYVPRDHERSTPKMSPSPSIRINARSVIRLGHSEWSLTTEEDFTEPQRVGNHIPLAY